MTCDDRRDSIFLYAAGELEPAEQAELRAHLSSGCPACAGELARAEANLSDIPLSLNPQVPSSTARDKLMQRIATPPHATEPARPRRAIVTPWSIFAGLVGLAAGVAIAFVLLNARNADTLDQLKTAEAHLKLVDAQLADAQFAAQVLNAEKLRLVSLASNETVPTKPTGRIIYDEDNRMWHLRVFDLSPMPKDKCYELWFVTPDQKKIRAGTFNTDSTGSATMMVQIPKDVTNVMLAAITDEPAGGMDQPTGKTQLAGKVATD